MSFAGRDAREAVSARICKGVRVIIGAGFLDLKNVKEYTNYPPLHP